MNLSDQLKHVQNASREVINLSYEEINNTLLDLADELIQQSEIILKANQKDLDRMNEDDPKYDRLLLNQERLEGIANDIKNVVSLDAPLNKILEEKHLENNLHIQKTTVPLGVIGIIYEARPNVTFDVFSLCFKSGNACVLKGGSDAADSNIAIINIIHSVLKKHNINTNIVHLLSNDRDETLQMMQSTEYIDIIIPRGSQGLINFVRENSKVPVIETGAGIVHTYFDETADIEKGKEIIFNAKTRRVSVCNALDCLIIHKDRLKDLPMLTHKLQEKDVVIFADESSYTMLDGKYSYLQKATKESFGTEFLSYTMSIKTVSNIQEAVNHINHYSSKHSEAILSSNENHIEYFLKNVDAAAVYANTSTAFTDGAQFGLGAEIGISTQKLHARGPMALEELTSYKWIIRSEGQSRS